MGDELTEPALRIVHLSDLHFWRYALNPAQLFGKRLLGMGELLVRRARRFRLERADDVIQRVRSLAPDHVLITGDITTTALPVEFRAARHALEPLLNDLDRVTIVPGNHDRYTLRSHRDRLFEEFFGEFAPAMTYPWLRFVTPGTAILGLDPTRASLTARGKLPERQLDAARELIAANRSEIERLLIACHYPTDAPPAFRAELAYKRLNGAAALDAWLATIGPHLYCCGHVHAAWAFNPPRVPNQLSLNAGAPLLRDHDGRRPPGFLEIMLMDRGVTVRHHAWRHDAWECKLLHRVPGFFDRK